MRRSILAVGFVLISSLLFTGPAWSQEKVNGEERPAFEFAKVMYFHRHSEGILHEYTPAGQDDLDAWTDMVSIIQYRTVKDAETLRIAASALRDKYQASRGTMIKSAMIPATKEQAEEYLIVTALGDPQFIEAVFARLRIQNGVGIGIVYSHRVYGRRVGDEMSRWLEKHGPATEEALLAWDAIPKAILEK